jgi:hypothetical protein
MGTLAWNLLEFTLWEALPSAIRHLYLYPALARINAIRVARADKAVGRDREELLEPLIELELKPGRVVVAAGPLPRLFENIKEEF